MDSYDIHYMRKALQLASESRLAGNEPFGALLVKDGQIVIKKCPQ
ncbi:tRNA-specific adenosine deaminase [Vallitalea okinawensis]|nr:hypothetical protein [Vallitalea okinawensis]